MDTQELFRLGKFHLKKEKPEEAVECFRKAAEAGHAQAQYKLGDCYWHGIGVEENEEEAVKWYLMAANQGNDFAKDAMLTIDPKFDFPRYIAKTVSLAFWGNDKYECYVSPNIRDNIRQNAKTFIIDKLPKGYARCSANDVIAVLDTGIFSKEGKVGVVFTKKGVYLPHKTSVSGAVQETIIFPYEKIVRCEYKSGFFNGLLIHYENGKAPYEYSGYGIPLEELGEVLITIIEALNKPTLTDVKNAWRGVKDAADEMVEVAKDIFDVIEANNGELPNVDNILCEVLEDELRELETNGGDESGIKELRDILK